jgi:hypothetical protein
VDPEPLLALLRAHYAAAPGGVDAPEDDRREVERRGGEGAQAYGELSEASTRQLLAWLAPGPADVLFDLGSGVGKVVLLAACLTRVGAAVGVELSAHHHAVAEGARAALAARAPEVAARARLVRGDLRHVDLSGATIVHACATCFPDPVRAHVARAALAAPRLRALLMTRPPPPPWDARLEERGRVRVTTSWSQSERVIVYGRRG